ncbi:hypothetical protein M0R45_014722 [Rubus argutus]|uniref:Bulb-type lectin domain-containing protein n=1 Tax=Rubus argutus TaxID=59490 RepID=A0AAW1XMY9_RUBAR
MGSRLPIWSTNVSHSVKNTNTLSAQILDTGKLGYDPDDKAEIFIWQSFDYPTGYSNPSPSPFSIPPLILLHNQSSRNPNPAPPAQPHITSPHLLSTINTTVAPFLISAPSPSSLASRPESAAAPLEFQQSTITSPPHLPPHRQL